MPSPGAMVECLRGRSRAQCQQTTCPVKVLCSRVVLHCLFRSVCETAEKYCTQDVVPDELANEGTCSAWEAARVWERDAR